MSLSNLSPYAIPYRVKADTLIASLQGCTDNEEIKSLINAAKAIKAIPHNGKYIVDEMQEAPLQRDYALVNISKILAIRGLFELATMTIRAISELEIQANILITISENASQDDQREAVIQTAKEIDILRYDKSGRGYFIVGAKGQQNRALSGIASRFKKESFALALKAAISIDQLDILANVLIEIAPHAKEATQREQLINAAKEIGNVRYDKSGKGYFIVGSQQEQDRVLVALSSIFREKNPEASLEAAMGIKNKETKLNTLYSISQAYAGFDKKKFLEINQIIEKI